MDAQGRLTYEPLKIVIPDDEIDLREASRITGLSARHLAHLCDLGVFKSAHKPGHGKNAQWRLSRSEVLQRNLPPKD